MRDTGVMPQALTALREAMGDAELADAAIDLLQRMLHIHPSQRCTITEALSHELFMLMGRQAHALHTSLPNGS